MKFKTGDEVTVTIGKDRGKRGKIEAIFPKRQEVIVAGVNIYKRHLKPRGEGKPGGIVDKTIPLSVAKIALICHKCGKPTRIGYQVDQKDGKMNKLRVCRKCGGII
ncbi:MAG: 50S ribosomal protein L24 [Candidatus Gottesmanbacteria bacterium]